MYNENNTYYVSVVFSLYCFKGEKQQYKYIYFLYVYNVQFIGYIMIINKRVTTKCLLQDFIYILYHF